jgi:putative ABC transport system permease protein
MMTRFFQGFFFHFAWRYLTRHYWQSILMVIAITIGVAVMVGIDIANETARRGFDLSTEAITGKATHSITAGSQGVDEQLFFLLKRSGNNFPLAPIISDYTSSPQLGGELLQILGVDPFSEAPFRSYFGGQSELPLDDLTAFLTQPGGVLISQELAERYGLQPGDPFDLEYAGKVREAVVAGLVQPSDSLSRRALSNLLLMDISTAQEITGKVGIVDRIDLIVPEDLQNVLDNIQQILPAGTFLSEIQSQNSTTREMTAAFSINLTALSLLAMVVGVFLIYNTMTFSVIQRRPYFGTLRCLGVTRREVFRMIIIEALVVGIIGATFGILLGILMGRGSVQLVTQTINDLFYVVSVRETDIPVPSLVKGAVLGMVATVVAAAFPAWEAASVPPRTALSRSGLESKALKAVKLVAIAGGIVLLIGTAILLIPTKDLVISFAGTFSIIIGLAMLTPVVTLWLMAGVSRITGRFWGVLGRMAPREVTKSISRTSIAVAALMISVAVTIGVNLMVNSFRTTVTTWMNQVLHGDIYVSVPGISPGQPSLELDPEVIRTLEKTPGIERIDLLQTALVDSPFGPIQVSANNNPNDGLEQIYASADYPPEQIWEAVQQGSILVSEPLANRLKIPRNGSSEGYFRELSLNTDVGLVTFPVAGIYYDYASSQGNVIFALDVYREYWQDEEIAAVALLLEEGQDVDQKTSELKTSLAGLQKLQVRPNQALRAETLEVFDRTFAITGALQVMTIVVAFIGILSAMMSLQLDKGRQHGILKAIGTTSRQLWGLITLETGLMGGVAGIFAMPTGLILAMILIYIINKRSFGWTLQLQLDPEPFIQALVISILAALLAGLYPAWRIVRRNTAEAVRFE